MKATLSVPLVGAALLTTGAVYFGLLRCRTSVAESPQAADGSLLEPGGSTPEGLSGARLPLLDDTGSLLERLRERGF
jgi:hypothetical protein